MEPRPDPSPTAVTRVMLETETNEIVGSLQALGVRLRVLGSLGVSLRCPSAAELVPAFERTYADIDFAGYRREANAVSGQLGALGYVADREVTLTSEGRRGLYDHPAKGIHVDVFFDLLDFCHRIPLEGRLDQDRLTLPLAELLLSKLQIVRINEKDVIDIILLLLDHDLGEGDEVIDVGRVARLCAADWGLWRTTTGNLGKVSALALTYRQLDDERRSRVTSQVDALLARLESEPKTLAWRARARIGERVQWWTDVEEVR